MKFRIVKDGNNSRYFVEKKRPWWLGGGWEVALWDAYYAQWEYCPGQPAFYVSIEAAQDAIRSHYGQPGPDVVVWESP